MKVLFVCSLGRMRSKTAAHCIGGIEARYCGTDQDADVRITPELIQWADKVICMEYEHLSAVEKIDGTEMVHAVWNIPDRFDYMEDELVWTLRRRAEKEGIGTTVFCQ